MAGSRRKRRLAATIVGIYAIGTVVARWRGYRFGTALVVRCRRGHVFTTIWIPGISFKSLRLGWWRFQRCPVGEHWSIATPMKDENLTESERRAAAEHRDIRIP
jgi:hypothetical protein